MKYIVYHEALREYLISFPDCINHDHMAEAVGFLRFGGTQWRRSQGVVVSAGFIVGGECLGRSESLKIGSRKVTDTDILNSEGSRIVTMDTSI